MESPGGSYGWYGSEDTELPRPAVSPSHRAPATDGRGSTPTPIADEELVQYVGEERPDDKVLIYTVHDGHGVPGELVRNGEAVLLERPEVLRAYRRERDWGANLVAGHLARELGLSGFLRLNLARVFLDFNRFPGWSPPGISRIRRKSIFPPLEGLLSRESKHALLARYYDRISRDLMRRFTGKALIVAIHTFNTTGRDGTRRPEIGLITGLPGGREEPAGFYDPLFPQRLAENACDPGLGRRLIRDLERVGPPVTVNDPYWMFDGCIESRAQVTFFFRYLARRFADATPGTRDRLGYRRVWDMLLDVTRRSGYGEALRAYLHRGRPPLPGSAPLFVDARRAYRAIARFWTEHRLELLRDYRFALERPNNLAIEVRKDLVGVLDREGHVTSLRTDADDTARALARQLAGPIDSYLHNLAEAGL